MSTGETLRTNQRLSRSAAVLRQDLATNDYCDVVIKLDPVRARFVAIIRNLSYDELKELRSNSADCADRIFCWHAFRDLGDDPNLVFLWARMCLDTGSRLSHSRRHCAIVKDEEVPQREDAEESRHIVNHGQGYGAMSSHQFVHSPVPSHQLDGLIPVTKAPRSNGAWSVITNLLPPLL